MKAKMHSTRLSPQIHMGKSILVGLAVFWLVSCSSSKHISIDPSERTDYRFLEGWDGELSIVSLAEQKNYAPRPAVSAPFFQLLSDDRSSLVAFTSGEDRRVKLIIRNDDGKGLVIWPSRLKGRDLNSEDVKQVLEQL